MLFQYFFNIFESFFLHNYQAQSLDHRGYGFLTLINDAQQALASRSLKSVCFFLKDELQLMLSGKRATICDE